MKRREPTKTADKQSQDYDEQRLESEIELAREILGEAEFLLLRLRERKLSRMTIPAGAGSESYDRAKKALKAWVRGLRTAMENAITKPK